MRRVTTALLAVLAVAGCRSEEQPDAYGNVETTEIVVSAETAGRITTLSVRDGARLRSGEVVGTVEVTNLALEEEQVRAQRAASAARLNEIAQQIEGLAVQRDIARRSYERTRRLLEQRAATAQQLDQTERDYRLLDEQIDAVRARAESLRLELAAADIRIAQVQERVAKGQIINPAGGTVLATYARAGEMTQPGKPLYRIANLETMEVRAYVTEEQLARVRIGQAARVAVDVGRDEQSVINGTVTWVSPDAEFTPTPIQTREERADLVYAVKIRLPNPNGMLKIGMPAEVDFVTPS